MKQHGGMRIYLDKSFVWTLCTFRRRLNVFPPLGFLVAVGRAIGGSHKIPRCITCCTTTASHQSVSRKHWVPTTDTGHSAVPVALHFFSAMLGHMTNFSRDHLQVESYLGIHPWKTQEHQNLYVFEVAHCAYITSKYHDF
jgi:hypothetical protein